MRTNTKTATDAQTAAIATATIPAAGADHRWRIKSLSASMSDLTVSRLVQIKSAATVIWQGYTPIHIPLDLQSGPNEAVTAVLASGGGAVVGAVSISATLE